MNETHDAAAGGERKTHSRTWFLLLLAAIAAVGFFVARYGGLVSWLISLVLMATLVIAAGKDIQGYFFGFMIDRRNRYSLSRLQALVWTLIVLSAFLTAVFINLRAGVSDPLAVAVPEELWVLMGISVTSLLGSPLLLNQKRATGGTSPASRGGPGDAPPADPELARQGLTSDGEVVEKVNIEDATWSDLFKGEDTADFCYLDISRVQMFFFTFILVIAYAWQLGSMFVGYSDGAGLDNPIDALPEIAPGMLALLGISHTAYLGNKVVPSRRAG